MRAINLRTDLGLRSCSSTQGANAIARDRQTIVFMPESAYGPTNNCIGIGKVLEQRGHRVVFAAEASWKGRLSPLGFEENLVDLAPPPEGEQDAGQFWTDFIVQTAGEFHKPTIEQLDSFIKPVWESLFEGARYAQPQLKKILDETDPDVIVEDNINCFPALMTHGSPWVRIVSCNPLEVKDPALPPPFSGYALDDRTGWDEFRTEYERTHGELWRETNEWVQEEGAPPMPPLEFIHSSRHLNLYLYPSVADYPRTHPLGPTWQRLESSVRETEESFEVPDPLRGEEGALIYLSLGSLGSADVDLMMRLISILARTPHRYIVSKGPRGEEFELADNMWGEARLPQTSIIPKADLVITHGGNNTTTEAFHFGKPMIVLPLFWDQYDNAQRVQETGCGMRLDTYHFDDAELTGAIERLLADDELRQRMTDRGAQIRHADGKSMAADLIERVGAESRASR